MTRTPPVVTIRPLRPDGPPGYGHNLLVDPARTAVVIVDMQCSFVDALPFEALRRAVDPTARFLPVARTAGMTVVHVTTEFGAEPGEAGRPGSRTRQMMDAVRAGLLRGSEGARIVPALTPRPGDLVVTKRRFSGFAGTELDARLAERGIDTLLVAGGTTTVCVESTIRDAMFRQYNAVLLADCAADMSDEWHAAAVARVDLFFGWVCTSATLAAMLSGDGSA